MCAMMAKLRMCARSMRMGGTSHFSSMQQSFGPAGLANGLNGQSGPVGHHGFNVVTGNADGSSQIYLVLLIELTQIFAFFCLFAGIEARLLKFMIANGI